MNRVKYSTVGYVSGLALLGVLTGCVVEPRHGRGHVAPPTVYVESEVVVVQDDYVYYPGYQVYYSNNRHQYIYLEGHSWVSRPAPPHVSVDVLFASPSVRLDFHDAPSGHHAKVVRQYPKHWAPPRSNHGDKDGHDEDHDEGRHKGKKGRD